MTVLPDVLTDDLAVVFCGTAAGHRSAARGEYYAGRGNAFWPTLHAVRLTPRLLQPREYAELPVYGLGLTDLAQLTSGGDSLLAAGDFDVDGLAARITRYRPRVVAFNGKNAAKVFLGRRIADYGPQAERVGSSAVWVLPSTSGAARGFWDLRPWQDLAESLATEPLA